MLSLGRISYTNHLGDRFDFGESTGAYIDETDLFDYRRGYQAAVGAFKSLSFDARAYSVAIAFDGSVDGSRTKFFEVVDPDAETGEPGTLKVGDWEISGIFVASENKAFMYGEGEMLRKMTFLVERPVWQRNTVKLFKAEQTRAAIINESHRASPITIEVFGPATTVNVSIGALTYEVNAPVPDGGRLVIDGLAKTARVVDSNGRETNVLDKRVGEQVKGSGYYLFEPIPSGYGDVTWHPKNDLRVTVHEQRMEVRLG